MISRFLLFLVLNFAALAIGGLFTSKGVSSDWYLQIIKAPWTPLGWVFGAAWTTIKICFSIYLAYLWPLEKNKTFFIGLFAIQSVLNILWSRFLSFLQCLVRLDHYNWTYYFNRLIPVSLWDRLRKNHFVLSSIFSMVTDRNLT